METLTILLSNKTEGERRYRIGDIVYCQSMNTKVQFWFLNGRSFSLTGSLNDIEQILHPFGFYRVQQSFLINIHHVICVKRSEREVVMNNYPRVEIIASRNQNRWDNFLAAWQRKGLKVVNSE